MPTLEASGSQLAVIATEHTLHSNTGNKVFWGFIDLTNLASGDTVEIRQKIKINAAGSVVQLRTWTRSGAQTDSLFHIPALPSDLQYDITLKQTAGTGRTFDWRILSP